MVRKVHAGFWVYPAGLREIFREEADRENGHFEELREQNSRSNCPIGGHVKPMVAVVPRLVTD